MSHEKFAKIQVKDSKSLKYDQKSIIYIKILDFFKTFFLNSWLKASTCLHNLNLQQYIKLKLFQCFILLGLF